VHRGTEAATCKDLPVVVLVNAETSGGAELVAAALRDHGRAVVAGQRTRGKASGQTPLPIGLEGGGFKLPTRPVVRPSGKNLHRFGDGEATWGVLPDLDCRISPQLSEKLKRDWLLMSLRPASARERLPLDDPLADAPLREAAQFASERAEKPAR